MPRVRWRTGDKLVFQLGTGKQEVQESHWLQDYHTWHIYGQSLLSIPSSLEN